MAPFQPGDVVAVARPKQGNLRAVGKHVPQPKRGTPYRVIGCVWVACSESQWGVELEGIPSPHPTRCWPAYRFRKIDDEVTEEFREQLRKLPTKQGQPA